MTFNIHFARNDVNKLMKVQWVSVSQMVLIYAWYTQSMKQETYGELIIHRVWMGERLDSIKKCKCLFCLVQTSLNKGTFYIWLYVRKLVSKKQKAKQYPTLRVSPLTMLGNQCIALGLNQGGFTEFQNSCKNTISIVQTWFGFLKLFSQI